MTKWHQKTKAGQASEQSKRNMMAIKVMEVLAMGCYCAWKNSQKKNYWWYMKYKDISFCMQTLTAPDKWSLWNGLMGGYCYTDALLDLLGYLRRWFSDIGYWSNVIWRILYVLNVYFICLWRIYCLNISLYRYTISRFPAVFPSWYSICFALY